MTGPYKRACHQTNFSYGGFVKEVPFFFLSLFLLFSILFVQRGSIGCMPFCLFFTRRPQAAGVPPNNSGDMRWGDNYRKIVHVSVIVVVIVIYMCPTITKLACVLITTLKQRHVNVTCILVA